MIVAGGEGGRPASRPASARQDHEKGADDAPELSYPEDRPKYAGRRERCNEVLADARLKTPITLRVGGPA